MDSAIETTAKMADATEDSHAKKAKGMSSAGVALSIAVACVVWGGYALRLLLK